MTPLLAGALLTLAQGPYSPAPPGEAPPDAPFWVAGQPSEEHVFRVSAAFECPAGTADTLLQVSISDTLVLAGISPEENARRRVLTLTVPGKQLQGLRPELFCPRPASAEQRVMRLESRFTGQGALICRDAAGRKTTAQASVALDAWVVCPAEGANLPEGPERPSDSAPP